MTSARPAASMPPWLTGTRVPLREPDLVMRLERLGSFFPTRLSFMPSLVRRMNREGCRFLPPRLKLDSKGFGHAVYGIELGGRRYSLIAFSQDLPDEARSDRVIAEAWDATFVLYDGDPDPAAIKRLERNVPKQEAGRCSPSELVLSRANKSVRIFEHVAESLAAGRQPDAGLIGSVGYLMRTTAVYGNGKFGIADRARIEDRPELAGAFQAEMLTVYLIRCFTLDLVEHVARARDPEQFVPLDPTLKRHLGIGNSTGLGMAPFLINHPTLINNWIAARETALARVRSLDRLDAGNLDRLVALTARARRHVAQWSVADERQSARIATLARDLEELESLLRDSAWRDAELPWDALYREGEVRFSLEGQEMLVSLLLEPHGELIDGLCDCMVAGRRPALDPRMTIGEVKALLRLRYDWAFEIDFAEAAAQRRFWYVSEEKMEPRLGERESEPGAELEMPLGIAREVQRLAQALEDAPDEEESVAAFLLRRPAFRHILRRVQAMANHPYGEIRGNLLAEDCLPIDLLRCKLSFFGASKFDPKSDRWTRITLFQGAPLPQELGTPTAEDWSLPVLEA